MGEKSFMQEFCGFIMKSYLLAKDFSPVILWFDLKQIATQTILKVSSREKCALQHTKSPKEFLGGKCKTFPLIGDYIIREFKLYQGSHFSSVILKNKLQHKLP